MENKEIYGSNALNGKREVITIKANNEVADYKIRVAAYASVIISITENDL